MKIHHFTIPAREPERVARVLAELLGARVIPSPHPQGSLIVYAGDADGTCIEVWPAVMRAGAGNHDPVPSELPLPPEWPHHGYVTSDAAEPEKVLAIFAREGWKAEKVYNGPPGAGFHLIRAWIENQTTIEICGREMREEYERFFRDIVSRASDTPR